MTSKSKPVSKKPTPRADSLMLQVTEKAALPIAARKKYLRDKANQYLQAGYLSLAEFNTLTGGTWLYRSQSVPTMATVLIRGLHMAPVLYRLQQARRPDGTTDKSMLRIPAEQIPEEYLQDFLTQLAEEYLAASRQDALDAIAALLARLRRLRGLQAARGARIEQSRVNAKQRAVLAAISDDDPTGVLSEWKPSAFDPRVDPTHPAHEIMTSLDTRQLMQRLPDPFIGSDDLRFFLERMGWWFYRMGLLPARSQRALLLVVKEQYENTPAPSRAQDSNPANQIRYWCYGKKTKILRTTAEPVLKYLLELIVAHDETLDDAIVSQLLRASEEVVDRFLTSPRTAVTFLDSLPTPFTQTSVSTSNTSARPVLVASRLNDPAINPIPTPASSEPLDDVQDDSALSPLPSALLADWQALMDLTDTDSPDAPREDVQEGPAAATTGAPGDAPDTGVTASVTAPVSPLPQLSRPADWPPPDYRIDPETGVLTDYTVYPDDADIDLIWQHNGGLPLSLDDVKALV